MEYFDWIVIAWTVEMLLGIVLSARQLLQGRRGFLNRTDRGEGTLYFFQMVTGALGLAAFLVLVSAALTTVYVYPLPENTPTTPYLERRSSVIQTELVSGMFLIILMVSVPEFLNIAMNRYFAEEKERRVDAKEMKRAQDEDLELSREIRDELKGEDA